VWDYLFKTAYIPYEDPNTPLGFEGMENFPKSFIAQELYPIQK